MAQLEKKPNLFLVFTENVWGEIQFNRLLRSMQKVGMTAEGGFWTVCEHFRINNNSKVLVSHSILVPL